MPTAHGTIWHRKIPKTTVIKYAVIGNPIQHSKSPQIHNAFAHQEGVALEYTRMLSEPEDFIAHVNAFHASGGLGLNVTVPFKIAAYQNCSLLDDYAQAAQAVNTISFNSDGDWFGANTDGIGLLQDLTHNLRLELQQQSILILGAGGSARGILLPLLRQHPQQITIANRTLAKAELLAQQFATSGNVRACAYEQLDSMPYDLVINATSASLSQDLPPIPDCIVSTHSFCYDLAYSDQATVFMQWASRLGVAGCSDGIGMLIEQAAESYAIWRGYRPDTEQIFKLLRP